MVNDTTCNLKISAKISDKSKVELEYSDLPSSIVADLIRFITTKREEFELSEREKEVGRHER